MPRVPDHEERIARAERGLENDPAVQARRAQVEAAIARERSETPIEDFQLRIEDQWRTENDDDTDNRVRVTTRIPLMSPGEYRATRDARRAETEATLSLLEETALEQSGEQCLRRVEASAWAERARIYAAYARAYRRLIEWSEEALGAGMVSEPVATRFQIASRIRLATRKPEPPPLEEPGDALPQVGSRGAALVTRPELVRELVRTRSPGVSMHRATSRRYEALSAREKSQGRTFPAFVDLAYEANASSDRRDAGAQIALRVPLGSAASQGAERYRALSRSERKLSEQQVADRVRVGLIALREADAFERDTDRWRELLQLAGEAEAVAERWQQQRLVTPSQVGTLLDRAYDARTTVLEARDRAGAARCTLRAATGVALDAWPRE